MIRLLHLVAILGLIGSAAYAYSVKYESLYFTEELTKLRGKLDRERDGIAIAKAEWSLLTRPDRLQKLVDRNLDLQPMSIGQLARLSELPSRPAKGDEIGRRLEALLGAPATAPTKFEPKPTTTGAAKPATASTAARSDEIGRKLRALLGEPASTGSVGGPPVGGPPAAARPPTVAIRPAATPKPPAARPSPPDPAR